MRFRYQYYFYISYCPYKYFEWVKVYQSNVTCESLFDAVTPCLGYIDNRKGVIQRDNHHAS